jgi:protein TonB
MLTIALLTVFSSFASDTLIFRMSSFGKSEKSPTGRYLRKCIKEKDVYHCFDYGKNNALVADGYFTDTNFTTPVRCVKIYHEYEGYLYQSRCYENGKPHGYEVGYNPKGDTIVYRVFDQGEVVKEWQADVQESDAVFVTVETTAEYPGGRAAWKKYLTANLKYPDALKEKINGTVFVKFIVDTDGRLNDIKVAKGLHPLLDAEALRVVQQSIPWISSKQGGRAVKSMMILPIQF